MLLYLVRHAIAFEPDAGKWPDDGDRPLTAKGSKRFARAARGLRRLAKTPEAVLSSRLVRAWQTAGILHRELDWPAPEGFAPLESPFDPDSIVEGLSGYAGAGALTLVGHEPHMSQLTSLLIAGDPQRARVEFKKGGAACVRLDEGPAAGRGTLVWYAPPRLLRRLAR